MEVPLTKIRTILLLASILIWNGLHAQEQSFGTATWTTEVNVSVAEEHYSVISNNSGPEKNNLIKEVSFDYQVGEISIRYSLQKPERDRYYRISLEVQLDGRPVPIRPEDLLGSLGDMPINDAALSKEINWINLPENYLHLDGKMTLELQAELRGPRVLPYGLDCDVVPEFGKKELVPHYIGAGVGLAALGTGIYLKRKSDDIYNSDYLSQITEEQAEPYYQDASNKNQASIVLTYAGATILLVDAVWLAIRYGRYQQRKKAYNEFCGDKGLSLRPAFIGPQEPVGLRLRYNF